MPAAAVRTRPKASNVGRLPCGGDFRAELTIPTTAASAVFRVRKKLLAPALLADVRSAISTAVLYSSRIVPVSSDAIDVHLFPIVMARRFSPVHGYIVSQKVPPASRLLLDGPVGNGERGVLLPRLAGQHDPQVAVVVVVEADEDPGPGRSHSVTSLSLIHIRRCR